MGHVSNTKMKITLDFPFGNCSVQSLWNYISTSNKLSEWFAEEVSHDNNQWTFKWEDSYQEARLIAAQSNLLMKFSWIDDHKDCYFEMKILVNEITNQVALEITDFAEDGETEDLKLLWSTQIGNLMRRMGV